MTENILRRILRIKFETEKETYMTCRAMNNLTLLKQCILCNIKYRFQTKVTKYLV